MLCCAYFECIHVYKDNIDNISMKQDSKAWLYIAANERGISHYRSIRTFTIQSSGHCSEVVYKSIWKWQIASRCGNICQLVHWKMFCQNVKSRNRAITAWTKINAAVKKKLKAWAYFPLQLFETLRPKRAWLSKLEAEKLYQFLTVLCTTGKTFRRATCMLGSG